VSTFSIRAANQADLETLHTLMHQLHTHHHLAAPEHIKTADEIDQEKSIALYLDSPECLVYVAEQEEQIVGFITGHFCELVAAVSKPVQMGSVDELFVSPRYRQQGIAEALFTRLQDSFEDYGVKQVFVEVWEFNQSAIKFYHKMAFNHHIHWLRKPLG
jgi:ribosomal protein S18 acetylase RimI-like enzyme